MKQIAAVVVTYNRKKLLVENIQSLLNQTKNELLDIIIIDNNSTDDTCTALDEYIKNKKIIYKNTGSNLGGAGGFNFGIKLALSLNYQYIWLMDDDCIPRAKALEELLNAANKLNGNYGFIASKVLWTNSTICKMNIPRKTMYKNMDNFNIDLQKVTMASFVSLFIPKMVILDIGLPIKDFFIWTDDWEFTRRISLKYPCYYAQRSIVLHKCVTNSGANIVIDQVDKIPRYYYLYRNDVFLYRREGISGFAYETIRLSVHCLKVLLFARDHKFSRIKAIIVGTFNGFKFKPSIEHASNCNSK